MYKFNYQYLAPEGNPVFTCIVPTIWLSLDLPTFGGNVIYQDKRARAETLTDFVFEFSEISEMHSSERTFTLKVETKCPLIAGSTLGDSRDLFGKTIKVRYLTDANKSTNEKVPAVIVLLNHLFCFSAGSAYTGLSFMDIVDLCQWLSQQSELILNFETGSDLEVMIQNIFGRLGDARIANSYSNLFGKDVNMHLAHFSMMVEKLCCSLAYAPAVDQQEFLICTLISDRDFKPRDWAR